GTWTCRVSGAGESAVLRREVWAGDDWSGTHVLVEERRAGSETLQLASGRILADDGGYSLSYRMRGSGRGAPASYRSGQAGEREAAFVTEEAVEPQRIAYRRTATTLVVTHARRDGSGARSWHMRLEGEAGGPRGCDGR